MGGSHSREAEPKLAQHATKYSDLLDAMTHNRIPASGERGGIADIGDQEMRWFRDFEAYLSDNQADVNSDDALYSNLRAFVNKSQEHVDGIVANIDDDESRGAAETLARRVRTAVVLQKYYEYKYLHLSAVFSEYTRFVNGVMDSMSSSVGDAVSKSASNTESDLQAAVAEISKVTKTDADSAVKAIAGVHQSTLMRLKGIQQHVDAVSLRARRDVADFPAEQVERQVLLQQLQEVYLVQILYFQQLLQQVEVEEV